MRALRPSLAFPLLFLLFASLPAPAQDGLEDRIQEVVRRIDGQLRQLARQLPEDRRAELDEPLAQLGRAGWMLARLAGTADRATGRERERTLARYEEQVGAWQAEIEEIRARPWDRPALRDKTPEGNAAEEYLRIFESVGEDDLDSPDLSWLDDPGGLPDEETRQQVVDHADALAALRRATTLGRVQWRIEFEQGLSAPLPGLTGGRVLGQLLVASAVLEEEKDPLESARTLLDAMSIARDLAEQGTLISHMVAVSIESPAARAMAGLLGRRTLDEASLKAVATELERVIDRRGTMERAFASERLFAQGIFQGIIDKKDLELGVPAAGAAEQIPLAIWRPLAIAFILPSWRRHAALLEEAERAADLPWAESREVMTGELADEAAGGDPFLGLLLPNLGRLDENWRAGEARLRLLRCLVGAEMYRNREGRLPTAARDLAPFVREADRTDPWSSRGPRIEVVAGNLRLAFEAPEGVDEIELSLAGR